MVGNWKLSRCFVDLLTDDYHTFNGIFAIVSKPEKNQKS